LAEAVPRFEEMNAQVGLRFSALVWLGFSASAAVDFDRQIKPILEEKCYRCHDDEKVKGDLRLDSPEGILAGGKGGIVLVSGEPNKSSLFILTTYPKDDPDYMPQKGEGLSTPEQNLLRAWIEEGASFGKGFVHDQDLRVQSKFADADPDSARKYMIMGDALEVVENLRASDLLVDTVNHDSSLFEVSYTHADRGPGEFELSSLAPLKDSLKKLTLARTRITNEDLSLLSELASIEYLDLSRTEVDDQSLDFVSQLANLRTLNLRDTKITDKGLLKLANLKQLERVYVWGSLVTATGAKRLEKRIEGVAVKTGTSISPPNRGRSPQS